MAATWAVVLLEYVGSLLGYNGDDASKTGPEGNLSLGVGRYWISISSSPLLHH